MTRKDQSKELTAAAVAARAPGLVMMSCDDNLVFEHENLGCIWLESQRSWLGNDNAPGPSAVLAKAVAR